MQMNFDDVFDGAVEGQAELELRKAEVKVLGDKPALTISYVVVDSEPQGPQGLSANGEFINHVVWLPRDNESHEDALKKKKMLKRFLTSHGVDTSATLSLEEVAEMLASNRVHIGANCTEDDWKLREKGIVDTKIKSFFQLS